jgi:hypothetical protein
MAIAAAVLVVYALLSSPSGCGKTAEGEGFAIYLLDPPVPPQELATAAHVEIAAEPLISSADIVSYDRATHQIELTAAAYARVFGTDLSFPMLGVSFAVCVDRQPIYTGAFWAMISSHSFDGVVIMQVFEADPASERRAIRIELGYPGSDFFSGEDPRSDPAVLEALERAGKLR